MNYRGIVPFNLKSRLLAPTEREYVPEGRIHDWLTTSHIDNSYLESPIVTTCDSPGCSSTSLKPRRTEGGSPAAAGKCRYTCGICFVHVSNPLCPSRKHKRKKIRTSVPTTDPVFSSVKDTLNAGRCSHSAVDEPTTCGPG